ncbi:hypothetical protein EDD27_4363 [Nonomuraea polychroma]|uniref:Uncharacterized protein n=1 Tax=Nonomuraea polychroma TaxID=46176 RepID=A0A438M7V5_9ACTN|nr:hypothetical protein [Nonomuraea polychroma]RVX41792.1 hypothetical protein EDD27_4363 [Nonomuraea polychroma]
MKSVFFVVGDERPWAEAGAEERKRVYEKWGEYDRFLRERGAALAGNAPPDPATRRPAPPDDGSRPAARSRRRQPRRSTWSVPHVSGGRVVAMPTGRRPWPSGGGEGDGG